MSNINLLISGQIYRHASLNSFWAGFINIQKSLPSFFSSVTTFSHSWDPEYVDLAQQVYGCHKSSADKQPEYSFQVLSMTKDPLAFEDGDKRKNSTWSNISFQNVLGNLDSRSRVAALFENNNDYSLFIRWDFGMSGESPVNKLSFDPLLPKDYLYVSDFDFCDEGYADMWVGVPGGDVRRFKDLYDFALNCITLKNDFYKLMTKQGWVYSYANNHSQIRSIVSTRFKLRKIKTVVVHKLEMIRQSQNSGLISRIVRRLSRSLVHALTKPKIQAEYYSLVDVNDATFSKIQTLNIHAIFKYFLHSSGLRRKLRFCHPNDVYKIERGLLINSRIDQLHIDGKLPNEVDVYTLNAIAHWMAYENISNLFFVKSSDVEDIKIGFPCIYYGSLSSEAVCAVVSLKNDHLHNEAKAHSIKEARVRVYKYAQA